MSNPIVMVHKCNLYLSPSHLLSGSEEVKTKHNTPRRGSGEAISLCVISTLNISTRKKDDLKIGKVL